MEIALVIACLAALVFAALWLKERHRAKELHRFGREATDLLGQRSSELRTARAEIDRLRPLADVGSAAQAQRKAASEAAAAKRRAAKV